MGLGRLKAVEDLQDVRFTHIRLVEDFAGGGQEIGGTAKDEAEKFKRKD